MGDTLFETPNLDSLTQEELMELSHVFASLRDYVSNRIRAMKSREKGDIQEAIAIEKNMEVFYNALPKNYQW